MTLTEVYSSNETTALGKFICASDNYVYYGENSGLEAASLDLTIAEWADISVGTSYGGISVYDDSNIWVADANDARKYSFNGSAFTLLKTITGLNVETLGRPIAVSADWVFIHDPTTDSTGDNVRCYNSAGTYKSLINLPRVTGLYTMASDNSYLYIARGLAGSGNIGLFIYSISALGVLTYVTSDTSSKYLYLTLQDNLIFAHSDTEIAAFSFDGAALTKLGSLAATDVFGVSSGGSPTLMSMSLPYILVTGLDNVGPGDLNSNIVKVYKWDGTSFKVVYWSTTLPGNEDRVHYTVAKNGIFYISGVQSGANQRVKGYSYASEGETFLFSMTPGVQ